MIFEESGFRVTLPPGASFRLTDCASYRRLSPRQVSEMDVAWWDDAHQSLSLLEIKDYSAQKPSVDLLPKLVAKGRDCLVMLHAAWTGSTNIGQALAGELPAPCRTASKLRLLFVLKVGPAGLSRDKLGPIKDNLTSHIKVYAELLGMRGVIVNLFDHEKAIEKGLPISVI